MKSIIVLVLSVFCYSISTFAQKGKSEFALLLYNNEISIDNTPIHVANNFLNGFQFKYSLNNSYLIRLTAKFSDKIEEANYFISRNKQFDKSIGIERVFSQGKIRPFAFADMFYRYSNTNIKGQYYLGSTIPFIPIKEHFSSSVISSEYNEHFVGASFGLGLKYFPVKQVFISLEAAFTLSRNIFDGSLTPQYQINLNPVRVLTLGVNF
jgi:hypothetical protein